MAFGSRSSALWEGDAAYRFDDRLASVDISSRSYELVRQNRDCGGNNEVDGEIYTVNVDGTGLTQLTHAPGSENAD